MSIAPFNRRALLQTGAVAAGTLAIVGAAVPGAAAVASAPAPSLSGSLLAWVVLRPEDRAEIRLAHMDPNEQVIGQSAPLDLAVSDLYAGGERVSAWGQMRAACARAQDLAVRIAANAWGVAAENCAVEPGRIVHVASGRSVGFRVWAEFA